MQDLRQDAPRKATSKPHRVARAGYKKLPSSRKEEVYRELTKAIDGMDRNIAYLNENERQEVR